MQCYETRQLDLTLINHINYDTDDLYTGYFLYMILPEGVAEIEWRKKDDPDIDKWVMMNAEYGDESVTTTEPVLKMNIAALHFDYGERIDIGVWTSFSPDSTLWGDTIDISLYCRYDHNEDEAIFSKPMQITIFSIVGGVLCCVIIFVIGVTFWVWIKRKRAFGKRESSTAQHIEMHTMERVVSK